MKQNKETLKQFFETGDKPTQEQYSDLIDSYIDAKQPEGEANRRFVINETGEVSVASEQQVPTYQAGTNIMIDETDPLQPVINAAPRVNVTEGVFTPSFFATGSSFSVENSEGEYYTIGDRVFVDIRLSGVTSDGQATYEEVYITLNGIGFPVGVGASGIVYNIGTYENYGCFIQPVFARVKLKDRVWNNETLYISFSYTSRQTEG
ncbi:hypothetical protein [Tenacibaculum sp. SDUM215027]|uniref:hypothetical protein n=1 Tax=Tenacibaculum sp. SDUM215027 TaxID=3422596 RepID=UPI003D323CCE